MKGSYGQWLARGSHCQLVRYNSTNISKKFINAAVKLTDEIIGVWLFAVSWMHFANLRLLLVTQRHLSTSLPTTVPSNHAISDRSMLVDQSTRQLSILFSIACCCLFRRLLGLFSLPIIHPVHNTSYYVYSFCIMRDEWTYCHYKSVVHFD